MMVVLQAAAAAVAVGIAESEAATAAVGARKTRPQQYLCKHTASVVA
jgi:hypothetical protein